eukprot:4566702-Alexandrium_andersonii.AAC.1
MRLGAWFRSHSSPPQLVSLWASRKVMHRIKPSSAAIRDRTWSGRYRKKGVRARGKRGVQSAMRPQIQAAQACGVLPPSRSLMLACSSSHGPGIMSVAALGLAR